MATYNNKSPDVSIPILPEMDEQLPKKGFQENENEETPSKSPEISTIVPTHEKPSSISKTNFKKDSRFGEPSIPINLETLERLGLTAQNSDQSSLEKPTSSDKPNSSENPTSSKKPASSENPTSSDKPTSMEKPAKEAKAKEEKKKKEGPDARDIHNRVTAQLKARRSWRMGVKLVIELLIFLVILACLICSLRVERFQGKFFGGLEVWKWFVLLMAIFSGILVTRWVVHCIVFLIEWRFFLKKNVVYFTHGLQGNVVVFLWIIEVLVTWVVLFKDGSDPSPKTKKILNFITLTLASLLIGSFLYLAKTTLIKLLATSFHSNRFYEKIHEATFRQYVLHTLSGKPQIKWDPKLCGENNLDPQMGCQPEKKPVNWERLRKIRMKKMPSSTMKLLFDVVSHSGLSTMSNIFNQDVVEGGVELDDDKITYEEEAIATAFKIFYNVLGDKGVDEHGKKKDINGLYISKDDLHRFMIPEEVKVVFPWFEVNENQLIDWEAFIKWAVQVYKDRLALQHALNDSKTAVDDLNRILNGILVIIIIVLWLLIVEVLTTKLLVFLGSQLLVAVFIFGNSCKTLFEGIIFVFVMHPFDVGDRCVIDGKLMMVEEMNLLTTVFLKLDKEKLYYPNAVLATKTIGNLYRSPHQADKLDFSIHYRTPLSKIEELKERIKQYIKETPKLWHPEHILVVKEIKNVNKIKMFLVFNHTMNFQDIVEKNRRRTELVLQMKKIFDELNISYHLLPQDVHLSKTDRDYLELVD